MTTEASDAEIQIDISGASEYTELTWGRPVDERHGPRFRHWLRDRAAIGLAGAGALLVLGSFLVDWRTLVIGSSPQLGEGMPRMVLRLSVADSPTLGGAYLLSAMVLLTLFVGVVILPREIARPVRVFGLLWGLLLASLVTVLMIDMYRIPGRISGDVTWSLLELETARVSESWGGGAVCGVVAALALMAAVVIARPGARMLRDHASATADIAVNPPAVDG